MGNVKYVFILVLCSWPWACYGGTSAFGGFESGDTLEANTTGGTFSIQSTTVHSGTYAFQCNPLAAGTCTYLIGSYSATTGSPVITASMGIPAYIRFYFNPTTLPATKDEMIARIRDTANGLKAQIRINSNSNLVFYDSTTVAVATGTTVIPTSSWTRVEIVIGTSTTNDGGWSIYLNGNLEMSGANFLSSLATGSVGLGKVANVNSQSVVFYYDDYFVTNTALPGAGQTTVLLPVSSGTYNTWTTSGTAPAATHWQSQDELPPDADVTLILSDNVSKDTDTVTMNTGSSAGITGTVNSVKVSNDSKRDNASTAGAMRLGMISNGTFSFTTADSFPASAYAERAKLYDTDPKTGSAWTLSGLNTLEAGSQETSTTQKSRVTWVAVMVDYTPAAGGVTTPLRSLMGVGL